MARFSYSLDIALRMLMLLASRRQQRIDIPTMMTQLRVPYHNSVRVLRLLAEGGVIKTRRGRGGGVSLALPPERINLRQVMDLIDGPIGLVYCRDKVSDCPILPSCALKTKLTELENRINKMIEEVYLSELIGDMRYDPTSAKLA